MKKTVFLWLGLFLSLPMQLGAHPQTERYVPIGESSAETVAGTVQSHADDPHRLVVATETGTRTAIMDERTSIWIDRNRRKATSLQGTYADCSPGRYVEVKYLDAEAGVADWIKVRD